MLTRPVLPAFQGKLMRSLPAGPSDVVRNANIVFRTVRPADYSTPYDTMLKNGVQFTALEKQQSIFYTVAVSWRTPGLI